MPTGLIFTTWSITGGGNFDVANPPQALLVAGLLRVLTARPKVITGNIVMWLCPLLLKIYNPEPYDSLSICLSAHDN